MHAFWKINVNSNLPSPEHILKPQQGRSVQADFMNERLDPCTQEQIARLSERVMLLSCVLHALTKDGSASIGQRFREAHRHVRTNRAIQPPNARAVVI